MLSNPKTWIRNTVGNAAFALIESTVVKPLSTVVDRLLSLKTGKRSVLATDFKASAEGLVSGMKDTVSDARLGINTSLTRGKYDLPIRNLFDKVPILREWERLVKGGISDQPFYQMANKDALSEQLRLHKINTGDINKQNRPPTKMPYTFVVATDKGIRHI
jgi:hypothetical protein